MKKFIQLSVCCLLLAAGSTAAQQSAALRITATTTAGKDASFASFESLAASDLSLLKEIKISTSLSHSFTLEEGLLRRLLTEATALEALEVKTVDILSFPELDKDNTSLRSLTLRLNNLSKLPESIARLTALRTLNVYNPLGGVPAGIGRLTQLERLKFEGVEFTEFPTEVFALSSLRSLIISQFDTKSKIKALPDAFDRLPLLEELSVRNAALSDVPKSVGGLQKLENVYFNHNNLVALPTALAENPHLTYVNINDNPLDYKQFIKTIDKIRWVGVFYINNNSFSAAQYDEVQRKLPKITVFYTAKE
jgi:leucine-rich repeat-containing protein typical subtype